jgi:hypothetical protein
MASNRKPKFGDRMRSIYASERNPRREGIYVETIRVPHGRMNPGVWYRLTDGRGDFWETPANSAVFVDGSEPKGGGS